MAATEDQHYLVYAFAARHLLNLLYFNKANGAYRKKHILTLSHPINSLLFTTHHLHIGTCEGSLIRIRIKMMTNTDKVYCMEKEVLKIGVYGVVEMAEVGEAVVAVLCEDDGIAIVHVEQMRVLRRLVSILMQDGQLSMTSLNGAEGA